MGVALHNTSVHKRAGVALVTVTNNVSLGFLLSCNLLPLLTCGESTSSASAELGFGDLSDNLSAGHIKESLFKCRIAADSDILADGVRVDLTAMLENHTGLLTVEGDRGLLAVDLAVLFINQTVDALAADNCLFYDFFAILNLYLGVKPALGLDADKGTHLAEAVASALLESDFLAVRIDHKLNRNGKSLCMHDLVELCVYMKRTARNASCTGANNDLLCLCRVRLFGIGAVSYKFLSVFKHFHSPP